MNIRKTMVFGAIFAGVMAVAVAFGAEAGSQQAVAGVAAAQQAFDAARGKAEESGKALEVAKEAFAKAKADKAVAPERVKELKGQIKAAEEALAENQAAAKAAGKALDKAKAAEATAKKAEARAAAEAQARAEREAADKAKAEKKAKELQERLDAEKAKAEERQRRLDAEKAEKAEYEKKVEAEAKKISGERKAKLDSADKALADAKAKVSAAESSLVAAKDELAKAKSAKTPDAGAVEAAKAKVAAAKDELAKAEAPVASLDKARRAAARELDAAMDDARDAVAAEKKAAEMKASADEAAKRAEEAAKNAESAKKEKEGRLNTAEKLRKANAELDKAAREIRAAEDDFALANEAEELGKQRDLAEKSVADAQKAFDGANATLKQADAKLVATQEAVKAAKAGNDAAAVKDAEQALDVAKTEQAAAAKAAKAAGRDLAGAKSALASIKVPNALTVDAANARHKAAYAEYGRKLDAKNEAEREFLANHPLRVTTSKRKVPTVDAARAVLARECPEYQFAGDIVWLASTLVNGRPLCQAFTSGDPKSDIAAATRDAVQAGFYFAGFQDNGEKDGKREILADKGRIGAINVNFFEDDMQEIPTTNSNYSARQIARKMGVGNKRGEASEGTVFNFNEINNRFTELNGNPDIAKANVAFSPADGQYNYRREDGSDGQNGRAVTMDVNVTEERMPLHFVLGIDNFGSVDGDESNAYTEDSLMGRVTAQYLNMFGLGHIFTVNGSAALNGELFGVSAGYMIPRLDNGEWWDGNWTLHGGYTYVDEEDVLESSRVDIDVKGAGYFGGIQFSKRIFNSGRSTLDLSLGATYRYVESEICVDGTTYKYGRYNTKGDLEEEGYEILPLSVALMYSETAMDSLGGRNFATVEGIYGIGLSDLQNFKGFRYSIEDRNYWLARAQFARIQLLGDFNYSQASGLPSLFLRADGQYSPDPIVSAEQFAIGGHNSVRGYKERQFLGDSGCTGTLELRTPIYTGFFDRSVAKDVTPLDRWQFLVFADIGYYSLIDGKGTDEDDKETIYGVGAGFRLALGDHWQLRCDLGFALKDGEKDEKTNDETFDTDTCRLHVSLQAQW